LQRPVLLVGRHSECDVRIELPQISRRHCCVALAYDRYTIRDLGSRNGVRVNGRLVDEARLFPGDEIAIAQLIFRLEDTSPASVPSPPPLPVPAQNPDPAKPPTFPELSPADADGDLIALDDLYPSM
jgi:predicted component of type VI protein secretion system